MISVKRDVCVIMGTLSVIICLLLGLVRNVRPTTLLLRSLVCFAITVILCLFVITAVEKFTEGYQSKSRQKNVNGAEDSKQENEATSKAS